MTRTLNTPWITFRLREHQPRADVPAVYLLQLDPSREDGEGIRYMVSLRAAYQAIEEHLISQRID